MVADGVTINFFLPQAVNYLSFREAKTGYPGRATNRQPQPAALYAAKLNVCQG